MSKFEVVIKHGGSGDAYAKLEQLFKRYVKNIVLENAPR